MFPLNALYLLCWLWNAFTYPQMILNTLLYMSRNNSLAVKKIIHLISNIISEPLKKLFRHTALLQSPIIDEVIWLRMLRLLRCHCYRHSKSQGYHSLIHLEKTIHFVNLNNFYNYDLSCKTKDLLSSFLNISVSRFVFSQKCYDNHFRVSCWR